MSNTATTVEGEIVADAEAAGEALEHATESVGMPQLDFATFPNQIFWLGVTLVLIFVVLSRVALPRIAGILADRQTRITSDIEAAEALKTKAVEAEKAYNQAIVDARSEAARIVAQARAEIQGDLDKATAKADAEIAARAAESARRIDEIRAGAVASVAEVARETTAAIVAALGGSADAKAVTRAVADRVKE